MCQNNVTTVDKKLNVELSHLASVFTVIKIVTQKIERKTGNQKTSQHGRVGLLHTKLIEDTSRKTQNVSNTLRLEDMQGRKMQKGHTPLRSGLLSKNSLEIGVQIAEKIKNSLKTTFTHCRRVGQITLQTFSHSVGHATVENGNLLLNIYENPELLEVTE